MVHAIAHPPVPVQPALPQHIFLCRHPLQWTTAKIRYVAQKIFGYLLRLTVFQLGEYKRPLGYRLMRLYQRSTSDPRDAEPVNRERLERSKNLFLRFGAIESVVIPRDGKAETRLMTWKGSEFVRHIDRLGGQKTPILLPDANGVEEQRFAILPKPGTTPEQFKRLCHQLKKFSLTEIQVATDNGMQTGILLPKGPVLAPGQTTPMIVRFHSPGRSMVMDRKFAGLHVAAGYDICISDPRGTIDSIGVPSEGGYYLDAEAVLEHVLEQGYPINRIYVSGYCEGAAVAADLKQKYHAQGIHFIGENLFNRLLDLIRLQNGLGRCIGDIALPEIQSNDPAITQLVKQDGFDNTAKFRGLGPSPGKFVIIHTDTDRTVPKHSIPKIRQAIGNAGPYFEILRRHPNRRANGHLQPPTEDPVVWNRYVQVVT